MKSVKGVSFVWSLPVNSKPTWQASANPTMQAQDLQVDLT